MYYSCTRISSFRQKILHLILFIVGVFILYGVFTMPVKVSPRNAPNSLHSLTNTKKGYEVFGFAPYWTLSKMQNVDFGILTTFAYFGVPVGPDGVLDTADPGFVGFESQEATNLFTKAHTNGTRVVLTTTQMDAGTITAFLSNPKAQQTAIHQTTALVKERGIDGVNVDFEYIGDPGQYDRDAFSTYVGDLTKAMHKAIPASKVTVSVLATSAKDPTLYDISALSKNSDGIFMMAYDFANTSSTTAMPTSPLYGYKDGEYWYDVSTATQDFLTKMPANKLILGVPWYSYNYGVSRPGVNNQVSYWSSSYVETYATASADPSQEAGWDNQGQVSWKAYYDSYSGTWRMVFIEDKKSLALKYDFAKDKNLAGVGIWALGFDNGSDDMWRELQDKFGTKVADNSVLDRTIKN